MIVIMALSNVFLAGELCGFGKKLRLAAAATKEVSPTIVVREVRRRRLDRHPADRIDQGICGTRYLRLFRIHTRSLTLK
jgi:hypothetical protein